MSIHVYSMFYGTLEGPSTEHDILKSSAPRHEQAFRSIDCPPVHRLLEASIARSPDHLLCLFGPWIGYRIPQPETLLQPDAAWFCSPARRAQGAILDAILKQAIIELYTLYYNYTRVSVHTSENEYSRT